MIIELKFKNFDSLQLKMQSTDTAKTFFNFFKRHLKKNLPQCRDPLDYDWNFFQQLVDKVVKDLGWKWTYTDIKKSDLVSWHKDLERCLEKSGEMNALPVEHHQLIIDAHCCLHRVQSLQQQKNSREKIQIEWFTPDRRLVPENTYYKRDIGFGDVVLQNPYVGHDPLTCFFQDDYKNISRTCAFHDIMTPGFFIQFKNSEWSKKIENNYINWFQTKCADFVKKVGLDTILKYTGYPVVGKVSNLDALQKIQNADKLILENITTT